MNRERVKSFALALLVVMNFVLGGKIFTDEKLWPYGYNFFLSIRNSGILKAITNSNDGRMTKAHLTMPEQIIVNTGDQTSRIAMKPDDEFFEEINSETTEIIVRALKSKDIYFSPKNEWVLALGDKSLCLNYAFCYDTAFFGEFFDIEPQDLLTYVEGFSKIIITTGGTVYFEDLKSGNFYRAETYYNTEKLAELINKVKNTYNNNSEIINYATDLKFDEAFGNQKAVLSPAVPVYSNSVELPELVSVNPLKDENGNLNKEIIDAVLSVFKINASNVRRYSEADGTLVFVENNSILKVSPDGMIYYQSTDSQGFYLSSGESYAETVNALADFADKVNNACMEECELYLSEVSAEKTVCFDYRVGGMPVSINHDECKHAVNAEIKNGALTSYTQLLRNYIPGKEIRETSSYIEALDNVIEDYEDNMNSIEIQKVFLYYNDNGENPIRADWQAKVKSIVINREDMK